MEFSHILSALKRNNAIAILIVVQIAITLMIVSNSVFITMRVLDGWLAPTHLKQENLVVVWNRFFDPDINLEQQISDDVEMLRSIPGIIDVTTTIEAPFESSVNSRSAFTEDSDKAQRHVVSVFDFDMSGQSILDVELVSGRWYRPDEVMRGDIRDVTLPSVILVSETMAKELFPEESALGKTMYLSLNGGEPAEIIGIYKDFMGGDRAVYSERPYQTAIRPLVAWGEDYRTNYLMKTEPGMAEGLLDIVESKLYETEGRYITLTEVLTRTHKRLWDGRSSFAFTMLGISFIGLVITSLGIIGLVGLSVSQRKRNIGTRRALGATKWQVIRYFLIENSVLTFLGMMVGLVLSYGLNYILATEFRNEGKIELHYWLVIALVIWSVNIIATWVPARKAAQVQPAIVTRTA